MRTTNLMKLLLTSFAGCTILTSAAAQAINITAAKGTRAPDPASYGQTQIPNRPSTSLFEGEQGTQKTEIYFDPATHVVTVKMLVQDPNGYFIPNIRRDNFAVFENGVRQQNAAVEIEHAPVSLGLLLEYSGRLQAWNKALGEEVSRTANEFLGEIGPQDKVAIWKYGDKLEELSGFSQGHETLASTLAHLGTPPFSEVNFYDALLATLTRMDKWSGRKALLLISTGRDTFSKAKYQDVLQAVRRSSTPIYVINLGPAVRGNAVLPSSGPYARVDWNKPIPNFRKSQNSPADGCILR
jgi:hypothetical protein